MRDLPESVTDTPTGTIQLSRRQALATAGTLSLGATAGCLDAVPFIGDSRVPVEPEEPADYSNESDEFNESDDGPVATPEEFYYLLEDNGIIVEELYYDEDDNDLILFYRSEAENHDESDDEIGLIYLVFRDGLIGRGATINHLYTEVSGGFDGQVEGWGVNSEWAENDLAGEYDELDVWNGIINTMVFPDGEDRFGRDQNESGIDSNESDPELETDSNSSADE